MVDACESEQTSLLHKYVLSRKDSQFGNPTVTPASPSAQKSICLFLGCGKIAGCGNAIAK
eukprot:1445680-Amphidinium_carterae.2